MRRDLALAHAAVEREIQSLALQDGQRGEHAAENFRRVGCRGFLVSAEMRGRLGFFAEALLGAEIRLHRAHLVDRTAAGQRHDPAEGLALCFVVVRGLTPHFEEHDLQQIVHVAIVVEDSPDDGAQQRRVAAVEDRDGLVVPRLDALHEHFIGGFANGGGRASGEGVLV